MQRARSKWRSGWWGLLLVAAVGGCADSPLTEWAALNPWERAQWAEDAKFGPTVHAQREELRAIRRQGANLTAAEQQEYARLLLSRLADDQLSPALRSELVYTLGSLPVPPARERLIALLSDADPDVRLAAVRGLEEMGGAGVVQHLAERVGSDTDLDIRLAATRALARFDDPAAVQALGLALEENDPALQYRAIESLRSLTGRDYGYDVAAWREFVGGGDPAPYEPSLVERLQRVFR